MIDLGVTLYMLRLHTGVLLEIRLFWSHGKSSSRGGRYRQSFILRCYEHFEWHQYITLNAQFVTYKWQTKDINLNQTNYQTKYCSMNVFWMFFFSLIAATVNCSETTGEQIKKPPQSKNSYCSQYFTKTCILITSSQYFYLHFVHQFPLMFLLDLSRNSIWKSLIIGKFYCSFVMVYCIWKRFHNYQLCETFI